MTVSIYLDNSLEFNSNNPTNPVSACTVLQNVYPVLIGGFLDSDGTTRVPDCNGAVADVRIYDRVLSQSEIESLVAGAVPVLSEWVMATLALVLLAGVTLKIRGALPRRA